MNLDGWHKFSILCELFNWLDPIITGTDNQQNSSIYTCLYLPVMTTTTQSYTPAPAMVRPLGVTILALLNALGGLLTLVAGAVASGQPQEASWPPWGLS
jgi:hypothetical protein